MRMAPVRIVRWRTFFYLWSSCDDGNGAQSLWREEFEGVVGGKIRPGLMFSSRREKGKRRPSMRGQVG